MSFADAIEGGNMRHLDQAWAMWNILDMTPGGRGEQYYPALSHGKDEWSTTRVERGACRKPKSKKVLGSRKVWDVLMARLH